MLGRGLHAAPCAARALRLDCACLSGSRACARARTGDRRGLSAVLSGAPRQRDKLAPSACQSQPQRRESRRLRSGHDAEVSPDPEWLRKPERRALGHAFWRLHEPGCSRHRSRAHLLARGPRGTANQCYVAGGRVVRRSGPGPRRAAELGEPRRLDATHERLPSLGVAGVLAAAFVCRGPHQSLGLAG
jgi:hypothetical protein